MASIKFADLPEQDQSEYLCIQACKEDKKNFLSIKNRRRFTDNDNFWREILQNDGMRLCYYINYTSIDGKQFNDELIKIALKQNTESIKYLNINQQTEEYWILVVSINGLELQWCNNETLAICEAAIKQNPKAIQFARKFQNNEMAMNAVKYDGLLIQYIHDITLQIAMEAVKQNGDALFIIFERLNRYKWINDYNLKSPCCKYVIYGSCINISFEIYEMAVNHNIDILKSNTLYGIKYYEFRNKYCEKYDIEFEEEENSFGLFD
jgi:hypothetical protein